MGVSGSSSLCRRQSSCQPALQSSGGSMWPESPLLAPHMGQLHIQARSHGLLPSIAHHVATGHPKSSNSKREREKAREARQMSVSMSTSEVTCQYSCHRLPVTSESLTHTLKDKDYTGARAPEGEITGVIWGRRPSRPTSIHSSLPQKPHSSWDGSCVKVLADET